MSPKKAPSPLKGHQAPVQTAPRPLFTSVLEFFQSSSMFRVRYSATVAIWLALLLPVQGASKKHQLSSAKLTQDIEDIIAGPDSDRGFWGVEAMSLDSGRTIVALNSDKFFTPASNAKLFTTAAVFGLIGPDFRFKTTVETMGSLDKYGRLMPTWCWSGAAIRISPAARCPTT